MLLFRPLKVGRNFGFGCFIFFCIFCIRLYHAKSGSTNDYWTGLSNIKALSIVGFRKTSKKFSVSRKTSLKIFDFWSNFEFELISKTFSSCNRLFKLNLSPENLIYSGKGSNRSFLTYNQKLENSNKFAKNFEKFSFYKFFFRFSCHFSSKIVFQLN